jgi:1-acyl-sn-glycerol-3-phosphate acyltransferase
MIYDLVACLLRPFAWWGRMRVEGLEHLPAEGPVLVAPNHDSQMDPVVIGIAAKPRRRLRYLAQAELWKIPGLGWFLNGMRQIPIRRGTGDSRALDSAVEALKNGDAVAVFPEGRLSWGERVRARSGIGLLAGWVPQARIVLCTIEGTTDYVRFPKRPRVTVRFFAPAEGGIKPGEEPAAFSARLLRELRQRAPVTLAGRNPVVGGPPRVRRALARTNSLTAEPPSSDSGSDSSAGHPGIS